MAKKTVQMQKAVAQAPKSVIEMVVEEQPELDFSNLSYDDSIKFAALQARFGQAGMLGLKVQDKTITPEQLDTFIQLTSPESLEQIAKDMREMMTRVVVHLPDGWLVSNVPDGLDYNNPDLYRYVRADKVSVLRNLIQEAMQPQSRGNSAPVSSKTRSTKRH